MSTLFSRTYFQPYDYECIVFLKFYIAIRAPPAQVLALVYLFYLQESSENIKNRNEETYIFLSLYFPHFVYLYTVKKYI